MNKTLAGQEFIPVKQRFDEKIRFQWIFANVLGEVTGLGVEALIGTIHGLFLVWLLRAKS